MTAPQLLLIALTDSSELVSDLGELLPHSLGALTALTLPLNSADQLHPPSQELLLRFLVNLQNAWERHPLIPFRFGQSFTSLATLQDRLSPDLDQYEELLPKLGPCGEISLRIPLSPEDLEPPLSPSSSSPSKGRTYLESRRAALSSDPLLFPALQARVRDILSTFDHLSLRATHQLFSTPPPRTELELTLLLPREDLSRALQIARTLSDVTVTGPFPPLSFANP